MNKIDVINTKFFFSISRKKRLKQLFFSSNDYQYAIQLL